MSFLLFALEILYNLFLTSAQPSGLSALAIVFVPVSVVAGILSMGGAFAAGRETFLHSITVLIETREI